MPRATTAFAWELVRLDDDRAVGCGEMEATIADRLRISEVTLNLRTVRFDKPGKYEFRLFANDRFLGSFTLAVESTVRSPEALAEAPIGWWRSPTQDG